MYDFRRTNKATGVHWLKSPIEEVKIKVTLKPTSGIMCLPKFEEYTISAKTVNEETFENNEEHSVIWQQKVFSLWELQRYSDVHNCTSDTDLAFHNMLKDRDYTASKVFTYIHDDYHLPLPSDNALLPKSLEFNTCFEKLSLNDKIERNFVANSSSMSPLFKSEDELNVRDEDEKWKAMHIMFDNSEYNEDSQLVHKDEAVLLSLYHNQVKNFLLISPYGNDLDMNPYYMETKAGIPLQYEYAVHIQFPDGESTDDLLTMLKSLGVQCEKKHNYLTGFAMPSLGKKEYHINLEILSAKEFEVDNMYMEYNIKLPEGVQCDEASLRGRTHAIRSLRSENEEHWHFAYLLPLTVETDAGTDPSPLQIFFEVISTDWWGCQRTEGYCCLSLALEPGCYTKTLSCSRPEEEDKVEADSRRFFVGGCHLIKDLEVLAKPQDQDAKFTYTTTGSIKLRWSVLSHSHLPGHQEPNEVVPSTSASALLQGAEAALKQYKKAKAKLAAATKDLGDDEDGSGDG